MPEHWQSQAACHGRLDGNPRGNAAQPWHPGVKRLQEARQLIDHHHQPKERSA